LGTINLSSCVGNSNLWRTTYYTIATC
jgi:hypothetical protein